jgi:plasmid stability protein
MTDIDFNLPEETYRALRVRAAENGCSIEAEIWQILEEVLRPATRLKIGSELAAFGQRFGGLDLDIVRDKSPIEPANLE